MKIEVTKLLDFYRRRQRAYQFVFSRANPYSLYVLADMQDFCCANKTTAESNDPIQMALNEGRRQVWLGIMRAISMSPEEQFALMQQKDGPLR